jgi:hypothetical protein
MIPLAGFAGSAALGAAHRPLKSGMQFFADLPENAPAVLRISRDEPIAVGLLGRWVFAFRPLRRQGPIEFAGAQSCLPALIDQGAVIPAVNHGLPRIVSGLAGISYSLLSAWLATTLPGFGSGLRFPIFRY